jgi:hypothetical protein
MSTTNFASDHDAAEKGTQRFGETALDIVDFPESSREEHTLIGPPDTRNAKDTKIPHAMANPFAQYAAPEAPIWARYLDEADLEDNELIDPWSGSLDSLLIFVSRLHPLNLL